MFWRDDDRCLFLTAPSTKRAQVSTWRVRLVSRFYEFSFLLPRPCKRLLHTCWSTCTAALPSAEMLHPFFSFTVRGAVDGVRRGAKQASGSGSDVWVAWGGIWRRLMSVRRMKGRARVTNLGGGADWSQGWISVPVCSGMEHSVPFRSVPVGPAAPVLHSPHTSATCGIG